MFFNILHPNRRNPLAAADSAEETTTPNHVHLLKEARPTRSAFRNFRSFRSLAL